MTFIFSIIFSILLLPVCWGASLPKDAQVEVIGDFSGGLNTSVVSHKMNSKYSPDMQNVYIDDIYGRITKRNGSIVTSSTNTLSFISDAAVFNKSNGSKEIVLTDNSKVLATSDFNTFKTIRTGLNSTLNLDICQVDDKMWFTNGGDSVFTYDGSTVVVLDGNTYSGVKTPNVPKGKFVHYINNTVFMFNINTNPSSLYFSAIASTAGLAIAPDDFLAWPQTNLLLIDDGDGNIGTALSEYKGNLILDKSNGSRGARYVLYGKDINDFNAKRIINYTGCLADKTIVNLDGYQYFLGHDGVYRFNGQEAIKISDAIRSNIADIRRELNSTTALSFTNSDDFFRNNVVSMSTVAADGVRIILSTMAYIDSRTHSYSLGGEGTLYGGQRVGSFNGIVQPKFYGYLDKYWTRLDRVDGGGFTGSDVKLIVDNLSGVNSSTMTTYTIIDGGGSHIVAEFDITPKVWFTPTDNILVRVSTISGVGQIYVGFVDQVNSVDGSRLASYFFTSATTGSYISAVSTIPTISVWGNFDADYNAYGGTIDFYYKAATSTVNLSTYAWTPISPGQVVNEPASRNYIQWAASFTALTPLTSSPIITSVEFGYNSSGSGIAKPYAVNWDGRYWLNGSTVSDNSCSLIYLKARKDNGAENSWMKFTGLNLASLFEYNNNLYGGSISTGTVYRLNYSDSDSGVPINAYYDTPDLSLGSLIKKKSVIQYIVDLERQSNLNISVTSTRDFSNVSVSTKTISGTNRGVIGINNIYGKPINTTKIRVSNNDLNQNLSINAIGVIYTPSELMGYE